MLRFIPPFRSGHTKAKNVKASIPLTVTRKVFNVLTAAPVSERDSIPAAANRLLRKAVAFSDGDLASSVSRFGGRTHIEWKNLTIRRITEASVTEADHFSGVSKRCYVHLGSDAHRRWDERTRQWTAWETTGYALFPSAIVVEKIHGTYIARAEGLENFTPAPAPSKPSTSPDDLRMEMSFAM